MSIQNAFVFLSLFLQHHSSFATKFNSIKTCNNYLSIDEAMSSNDNHVCEQDRPNQSTLDDVHVGNVNDNDHSDNTVSATFSLAVVPYNDKAILPIHKSLVEYTFVGHKMSIRQNWATGGVAAVVWDAALTLCEYLENHRSTVDTKSLIEIGAGTGLVGMVSALLGAEVTVTDRKEVLKYLQDSVSDNIIGKSDVQICVEELDWTKDYSEKFVKPFDVIVGADVIYIEELFPDLLRTISQLSNNDTVILLSCRIRYKRDLKFLQMMKTIFSMDEILYDSIRDVKIFRAKKKKVDI